MLIKEFFTGFSENRDEVVEKFGEHIKGKSIQASNSDCPYIKKIVENRYNSIKRSLVRKQKNNLRGYNVTN